MFPVSSSHIPGYMSNNLIPYQLLSLTLQLKLYTYEKYRDLFMIVTYLKTKAGKRLQSIHNVHVKERILRQSGKITVK